MSVNKVRTLFLTSGWNAIDMPKLEALVESSTRLSFHVFAARHVARTPTQRSSRDHIRARVPNARQRDLTFGARIFREHLVIGPCSHFRNLALSLHCRY